MRAETDRLQRTVERLEWAINLQPTHEGHRHARHRFGEALEAQHCDPDAASRQCSGLNAPCDWNANLSIDRNHDLHLPLLPLSPDPNHDPDRGAGAGAAAAEYHDRDSTRRARAGIEAALCRGRDCSHGAVAAGFHDCASTCGAGVGTGAGAAVGCHGQDLNCDHDPDNDRHFNPDLSSGPNTHCTSASDPTQIISHLSPHPSHMGLPPIPKGFFSPDRTQLTAPVEGGVCTGALADSLSALPAPPEGGKRNGWEQRRSVGGLKGEAATEDMGVGVWKKRRITEPEHGAL